MRIFAIKFITLYPELSVE